MKQTSSQNPIITMPYVKYLPEPSALTKKLYLESTGPLPFALTNDYFFKAFLQENNVILKHLICALLHLDLKDILTVEITNPILLGKQIHSKTFVLDIRLLLNDHTLINLEMQVAKFDYWPERSLSYLCRNFDSLNKGEYYNQTKPVIHVGFLNFSLFPEHPEFHATYKIMNEKNHIIYTNNFILNVIDLSHIELATEEDRSYGIDKWASLFKAKTWEDIKMLTKETPIFESAAETIFQLTNDDQIRWMCEAEEVYALTMGTYENQITSYKNQCENMLKEIEDNKNQLINMNAEIAEKKAEIADKDAEIADKDAEIADKDAEIAHLRALLANRTHN